MCSCVFFYFFMLKVPMKFDLRTYNRFRWLQKIQVGPTIKHVRDKMVFNDLCYPFVRGACPSDDKTRKSIVHLLFRLATNHVYVDFELDDIGLTNEHLLRIHQKVLINARVLTARSKTHNLITLQLFQFYLLRMIETMKEDNTNILFQTLHSTQKLKMLPTKHRDIVVGRRWRTLNNIVLKKQERKLPRFPRQRLLFLVNSLHHSEALRA